MPWLTGDDNPSLTSWVVFIPDSVTHQAAFLGALLDLADPENWEQYGTQTPEQEAKLWATANRQTEVENSN